MWPVYGGAIIMERVYVCFGDTHTDLKKLKKKKEQEQLACICVIYVCVCLCVYGGVQRYSPRLTTEKSG